MKSPVWFSILLFAASAATAAPKPSKPGVELTPSEKWVVEQLTAGEGADLIKQFRTDEERKLNARFLDNLLTGSISGIKLHRAGIRIRGAIVDETIDVSNAQINCQVQLDHCHFMSRATFNHASFAGSVLFDGSTFEADADFSGMKVGYVASFTKTVFERSASFTSADIANQFRADWAQFKNKEEAANFDGLKVGGTAFLTGTVFEGPVFFFRADISGNLQADDTQFRNKQDATFAGIKIGHDAFFEKAVFEGQVDFEAARIANTFYASGAQFKNQEQQVSFNGTKIGHNAFFRKAIFEGPTNFIDANIVGEFHMDEAQFRNPESTVSFNSMRVGFAAFFDKAVFDGPVDFGAAEIASDFSAQETQFRNKTQIVDLEIKCGRRGIFKGVGFAGPVYLTDSSFLDLIIGDTIAGTAPVPLLDLSRSIIKRRLRIRQINIKDLVAPSLHVEGPSDLIDITVTGTADLSYSEFTTLDLSRSVWPKNVQAFHLQGMSYTYLRAAPNERESHEALLGLAGRSTYSSEVYANLEAFFLRKGYSDYADRAFISGKRRERRENLTGFNWIGSWLLDWLVGYGRHPWQAGVPCAFFVALGCLLFSREKMERQKPEELKKGEDPLHGYSRLWYSLGLFLPFVDLKSDKVWKPNDDERVLRHYMRIHILLGWILIPILLAAISGLIK